MLTAVRALPGGPYQSYVYGYPHKTAYRPLQDAPPLDELWRDEDRDALSCYAHIPFCEVRCGFCNLFTRVGAPDELTTRYLDALERQAKQARAALDACGTAPTRFAQAAIGGGTPTFLSAAELTRLLDIIQRTVGVPLGAVPLSVEASPSTATPDRLAVLAERGTTRLSLGVQTFDATEARAAVRPQRRADVERALDAVRAAGIPTLNVDLIYGINGQTPASWRDSLSAALSWAPEEIYLYPLYVRPLTGLSRRGRDGHGDRAPDAARDADADWDARRLALYRAGRDQLREHGYQQVSMRMFRRADAPAGPPSAADHRCQSDGMIGLGCGARSYTTRTHYSFDYAVATQEVRGIIDEYVATDDFTRARVGFRLDEDEQRRRHLLLSLLQADGVDEADYAARFGDTPRAHFGAELDLLAAHGLLADGDRLRLSDEGLAWSDAVGPLFFSAPVRAAMAGYAAR